ncbi:unnamed protein product, partial [Mesorhabditis belari]|uniref:Nitroreductase domain-containing protein n=1 Tax=Mesorhabditis belari TaxID=2138241 RepID=A0AAF3EYJ5_9BILA
MAQLSDKKDSPGDPPLVLVQKYLHENREAVLNCCVLVGVTIFIAYQARSFYQVKGPKKGDLSLIDSRRNTKVALTADKNISAKLHAVDDYTEPIREIGHVSASKTLEEDSLRNSQIFYEKMSRRRVTNVYKDISVPFKVVQNIVRTADTCPSFSSTNQPWTICVVGAEKTKCEVRHLIEEAAKKRYALEHGLADEAEDSNMVAALSHVWSKAYLSDAPFLILLFAHVSHRDESDNWVPVEGAETAVATLLGLLLAAIQVSGLSTIATAARHCDPDIRSLLHRPSTEKKEKRKKYHKNLVLREQVDTKKSTRSIQNPKQKWIDQEEQGVDLDPLNKLLNFIEY